MQDDAEIPAADAEEEINLLDIGVAIADNLKLLVYVPLAMGLLALGVAFLLTPIFTARMTFLPPQGPQQGLASAALGQLGSLAGLVGGSGVGARGMADQYAALLKSQTVGDRMIDRFKLMELYEEKFRQDARKQLENNTKITVSKEGLIIVDVDDKDPQRAADMANGYLAELQRLSGGMALTEAQRRRVFFEGQLEQTKRKLTEAEQALADIGVGANALKTDPRAAVEPVARLQAQVTAQEVRLAAMRGFLAETAPEFKQGQLALAALREQLEKVEAGTSLPATNTNGYIEKYRNFKYQEVLFELFARQFELAKADEAREGALIQMVDIAKPPEKKSKPMRSVIAILATLIAGMLMLVWIFIKRSMNNASPDVEHKLATIRASFRNLLPARR